MDWYAIFKFLHVASAVIWIGGGLTMVLLGVKADRAKNDTELVGVVRQVAWAAERIFVPASISTLVFGLLTTWLGSLWSELWVILGLVGIVATLFIGIVILTPRAKKAGAEPGVTPLAVSVSREILTIAKFDMTMLLVIIADMVIKPSVSDWGWLVAFAVVIVSAGALWLPPALRKAAA
jgi:hypothetical protein